MMLSAEDLALYFLHRVDEEAGDFMTNLRLQKMLYYAQAWHLAITDKSLFAEDFEAWMHGPVIPSVYAKYKAHEWRPIPRPDGPCPELPEDARTIVEDVWATYESYSAKGLENLTHQEDPWIDARNGCDPTESCSNVISQGSMRRYYAALLDSA